MADSPLTLLQQILNYGSRSYWKNFHGLQAATSRQVELSPLRYGYGGRLEPLVSNDNYVITNPWGSRADLQVSNTSGEFSDTYGTVATLLGGQSLDLRTGKYNDPTLHATTAALKTGQLNQRKAAESGLEQSSRDTARGNSVLATLDEQYWGSMYTTNSQSAALSQMAQVNQGGLNEGRAKSILGTTDKDKKAKITPPVSGAR